MKFQQTNQIQGKPKVLALDAAKNTGGWEAEMALRICNVMRRQQVDVDGPIAVDNRSHVVDALTKSDANCLFVMGADKSIQGLHTEMGAKYRDRSKVIAVYITNYTGIDMGSISFAAAMLVSTTGLTQKEAVLFYPEFFSELTNHSEDGISMPMVRFCYAKANRFAPGKVELKVS